jgi:alanyl-tRNA synthetase
VSLRAIADHARATAFLVATACSPTRPDARYVLRRIMRRAVYHGWLLGISTAVPARRAARDRRDGGRLRELRERRDADRRR